MLKSDSKHDPMGVSRDILHTLAPMSSLNLCHFQLPANMLVPKYHEHHPDASAIYAAFKRLRNEVENACTIYLQTMNVWLPVIIDIQLQEQLALVRENPDPKPDICALLLCIYLVTQTPAPTGEGPAAVQTLYTVLKSFLTTQQFDGHPSISMIQIGLLLAIYEEGNELEEAACQSIGFCSRMGYLMELNKTLHQCDPQTRAEEILFDTHKCVWWCIIILERWILHEHICILQLLMVQAIFTPEPTSLSIFCMSRPVP